VKKIAHDPFRIPRYQQGPMGGISILNVLKPIVDNEINKGSITVLLETSANDLIQSNSGDITGVIVENNKGDILEYKGQNIILASGGCASNPLLYEELHGVPLYCQMAYPESQGAGLILGQSVGGYLRGGENTHHFMVWCFQIIKRLPLHLLWQKTLLKENLGKF